MDGGSLFYCHGHALSRRIGELDEIALRGFYEEFQELEVAFLAFLPN